MALLEVLNGFGDSVLPILRTVLIVILLVLGFNIALSLLKRNLLKRAKRKKTISNIEIFTRIFKYVFLVIVVILAILSYSGAWTGFGLTVGLLSAALGWALQRPITGIAAWIMVVIKRPFEIGDRIIISGVKGDVKDISLTHIYLDEVGGISTSEEKSGRIIMIPNSVLFEQTITNYTQDDDYILDEVVVSVTYESNLEKAMEIGVAGAQVILDEFKTEIKKEPYARTYFHASGINVHIRYFVPARRRQEISSKITQEIHRRILFAKDVAFAYPHTELVFKNEKLFDKRKK